MNRLTCQGLLISASICYSWCLMFQREKHINLTTYFNRGQNNFRRKMSTPRYTISLVPRSISWLSQFLSRNNGSSNAFTAPTNTNYFFNVATSALAGALERFSGFFHSPLFAPSGTVRELNAVDSEHKKNHQNDIWRIYQLNKHLTKPGHVWSKFGSGSKVSLTSAARKMMEGGTKKKGTDGIASLQDIGKISSSESSLVSSSSTSLNSTSSLESGDDGGPIGRETRRRLVEWWSREYCAGRMRLCVIGKGVVLYSGLITVSLMQTWKIRWIICLIWQPIYSRPYQITVRILYPQLRIILLALTRRVYVPPLPRTSEPVTDGSYFGDRPWSLCRQSWTSMPWRYLFQ